jgi:DnaJ-domain-containing protein 1
MMPSSRKPRAFAPDPDAPGQACDAPGCDLPGEYRAPKSRATLRDFHWFCLAHVRDYNAAWDYNKGMTPEQIEAQLRADTSWQRPSWPLGRLGRHARLDSVLEDRLHAFEFGTAAPAAAPALPAEQRAALDVLGLTWPVTLAAVKAKYKELAKRHHPDANGGDKGSEERLKTINLAYATLRRRFSGANHAASPAGD